MKHVDFRCSAGGQLAIALLLLLIICSGLCPVPAAAAIVKKLDRDECQVALSGPIASGDLDRLKVLAPVGSSLCLDSPGGDFLEGLAIAEWLAGRNVTTVIGNGSSCYSACAIAFMGGSEWEQIYLSRRKLHVGGRLGFHAPYLIALSKTYSGPDLEATYTEGLQAVARMMKLGAEMGADGFIPERVMLKLLAAGPRDLYMVDDVIKARELGIELIGVPKATWTTAALCNACVVRNERRARTDACEQPFTSAMVAKDVVQTTFFGFAGEGSYYCSVRLSKKTGKASIAATIIEDEISRKDLEFTPLDDEDALPVGLKD
ncbi:hypothetical protein ELH21_10535 [Rhizobium leguminosarum]|uniref:COG3904 family protein n=1 Tax=Rhizobium leguminosarum TaxID=384 RepID=UPI0010323CB1|nr:hypothetical protein [Rhizobium leguminosarum]TBD04798.1 hypothetical protein ELH21_10535 [Rhizobium leguminosarum]